MSAIDDLKKKVQSLEDQLSSARNSLHSAMIAEYPLKPMDLVRIERPQSKHRFNKDLVSVESNALPSKFFYGRVERVIIRSGRVEADIAKQTKSGFHGSQNHFVSYGDIVTKVDSVPDFTPTPK